MSFSMKEFTAADTTTCTSIADKKLHIKDPPGSNDINQGNYDIRQVFSRVFRFPLFLVNLGGLRMRSLEDSNSSEDGQRCCSLKEALCLLYRIFVGLLHIANACRVVLFWVTTYPTARETDIARTLLAHFIMMYGSTLFVCDHLALHFYFEPFVKAVETYVYEFGLLGDVCRQERRVKCMTLLVVVFNFISIVFWAALDSTNSDRFVTNPFDENELRPVTLVFVHLAFFTHMFLMNVSMYGCLLLYTLVLCILSMEFRCTTRMMRSILARNDETTEIHFDRCRERHQSLCQCVAILSKLTRTFVVANMFYNITIMCVSIYGLSSSELSSLVFIFQFLCGVVINSCLVLFLTGTWGQLSTAAHSISSAVTMSDWSNASDRLIQKMNLLATHCSISKIGVDVYGLFTLDSSTPLMVIGTLVTYGVVVLQFQLDQKTVVCTASNSSFV